MVELGINVHDAGNGYLEIVDAVLQHGERVAPRGESTLELAPLLIVHHDPTDCLLLGNRPRLSRALAAVEALQLVGGFSDPAVTCAVAPRYADFTDLGLFHGAYGPRTREKLEHAIRRLTLDVSTRRATFTVWDDALDLDSEGLHDYPCTMSIGFQIRDGKLNMRVHMRSNDLWLGYPYDLFQFTTLQRAVARYLEVPVGRYVHFTDSMHVYERDLDRISEVTVGDVRPRLVDGLGFDLLGTDEGWRGAQRTAIAAFYGDVEDGTRREMNAEERWFADTMSGWWERHPEHAILRRRVSRGLEKRA